MQTKKITKENKMKNIDFADFNSTINKNKKFRPQQAAKPIINSNLPKSKPQFTCDSFELSTTKEKKTISKKKLAVIGALMASALAVVGGVAIAKSQNVEKIKKELMGLYGNFCSQAIENCKNMGVKFAKPNLTFKKSVHAIS